MRAEQFVPRFHFHIFSSRDCLDTDGIVLPDHQSAQQEAIRLSGDVLKDQARYAAVQDWRMEVTDETGIVLFQIAFSATPSAISKTRWAQDDPLVALLASDGDHGP